MPRQFAIACLATVAVLGALFVCTPSPAVAQADGGITREQFKNDLCIFSELYARVAMTARQKGTPAPVILGKVSTLFEAEAQKDPANRGIYELYLTYATAIIEDAFKTRIYEVAERKDMAIREFASHVLIICHKREF